MLRDQVLLQSYNKETTFQFIFDNWTANLTSVELPAYAAFAVLKYVWG